MKNSCFLLFFTLFFACNDKSCIETDYQYNTQNGQCENCKGKQGYNAFNLAKIRATKNAECMDLSKKTLAYLLDTAKIKNFSLFSYNQIKDYNFKGCKFDSAKLIFNHISQANFEGADLSTLSYGYATIKGKIDKFTKLPLQGVFNKTAIDSLDCFQ